MIFSLFILIAFIIAMALYVGFVCMMLYGWSRYHKMTFNTKFPQDTFITVLIPARNEAAAISALLKNLTQQQYPFSYLEIIVIDDHSEDDTSGVVERWIKESTLPLRLLKLNSSSGKKAAISYGVSEAKGELIITTDADCRVTPKWIALFQNYYKQYSPDMILGGVRFSSNGSLWHGLQAMEFQTLIGVGAATAALKQPVMCNGANLAYRKKIFQELKGYEATADTPSGDDLFLMYKVHAHEPGSVHFLKHADAYVTTAPNPDLNSFIQQRKRWAGKWSYYRSVSAKVLPVFLFMIYLFFIAGSINACLNGYCSVFYMLLFCKLMADFVFTLKQCHFSRTAFRIDAFVLLFLLYPFYTVFFGFFSKIGGYNWKGRNF